MSADVIVVRLVPHLDPRRDDVEYFAQRTDEDGIEQRDQLADAAWTLIEELHGNLPPAHVYRITIEPAADQSELER